MVEKYLIESLLIDCINNPATSLHDCVINLFEFCGSRGLLPRGKARKLAQKRVIDHLKRSSFIEKFKEETDDPVQKETMVRDFYTLMA